MRHAHLSPTLLVIVAVVILGACGGSDDDSSAPIGGTTRAPAVGIGATTLAPGQAGCRTLGQSVDGIYRVVDAGEVEVVRDGEDLRLVEARPADGWTATGDTEDDDDEVEVTFRSEAGGRRVVFDAEVDDGRLRVEVCER